MRQKIIDDNKLKTLLKEGKSYRNIGAELGVSAVAVCKRIKRLGLTALPESLEKLTGKEKTFAIAVASGQSRISAVMQAYDVTSRESAKALQQTLMKNPEIRSAIDDLMETKGIGREYRVEKLKQHLESPDPIVSLRSLDMAMKLADDAGERKAPVDSKVKFHEIDLIECRTIYSFTKTSGKCTICGTECTEDFCNKCQEKYPAIIDKIIRYRNGDNCAACNDNRRCYDFCKACKEGVNNG